MASRIWAARSYSSSLTASSRARCSFSRASAACDGELCPSTRAGTGSPGFRRSSRCARAARRMPRWRRSRPPIGAGRDRSRAPAGSAKPWRGYSSSRHTAGIAPMTNGHLPGHTSIAGRRQRGYGWCRAPRRPNPPERRSSDSDGSIAGPRGEACLPPRRSWSSHPRCLCALCSGAAPRDGNRAATRSHRAAYRRACLPLPSAIGRGRAASAAFLYCLHP